VRVVVGSDHAGFDLKGAIATEVERLGHQVIDVGAYSREPSDYPDFAEAVSDAVLEGKGDKGILICGSGIGASVAANKIPGIRAGNCADSYSAHQGVEHDDMNVLVLGSRVVGIELALELVRSFLAAAFTNEDRHVRRLAKVADLERRHLR
jgi:RpiB/LacA/LacB family sugar-phosphate isomerase